MSDHSDTSSINGDWEAVNDCSQEREKEMDHLREEMEAMKMQMDQKDEEIARQKLVIQEMNLALSEKDEEIEKKDNEISEKDTVIENNDGELKTLREKEADKDKEIEKLKSKIEPEYTVSLEEWMKVQIENVNLSAKNLKAQIMEVYKKISEKELAKAQSSSSSVRKQRSDEIQKMEDLCGQIWKDVVKKNRKCVVQITNLLSRVETSSQLKINDASSKNMPIESFLGEFTAGEDKPMSLMMLGTEQPPVRTIINRKAKSEGFFESVWKSDNGKEGVSSQWAPDNVERNGYRYIIEKNVLVRVYKGQRLTHVLTDTGMTFNSIYFYARV